MNIEGMEKLKLLQNLGFSHIRPAEGEVHE